MPNLNYSGLIALALLLVALVIFLKKYPEHEDEEDEEEVVTEAQPEQTVASPLDIADEDATVACLIASIEERQQSGKNVHILSVREVK